MRNTPRDAGEHSPVGRVDMRSPSSSPLPPAAVSSPPLFSRLVSTGPPSAGSGKAAANAAPANTEGGGRRASVDLRDIRSWDVHDLAEALLYGSTTSSLNRSKSRQNPRSPGLQQTNPPQSSPNREQILYVKKNTGKGLAKPVEGSQKTLQQPGAAATVSLSRSQSHTNAQNTRSTQMQEIVNASPAELGALLQN
eukprot:1896585-Rhodomonas_salina.1